MREISQQNVRKTSTISTSSSTLFSCFRQLNASSYFYGLRAKNLIPDSATPTHRIGAFHKTAGETTSPIKRTQRIVSLQCVGTLHPNPDCFRMRTQLTFAIYGSIRAREGEPP
ncbi:unnamed protein product [Ectocarpus sp. 13 AM-2016]